MSEKPTVIKAEHIGKKYVIRHNRENPVIGKGKTAGMARRVFKPFRPQTKEDFWALKDITFEIKQGERVGIIGKNGAGKSTLLKLLSRITEPTEGRIELLGKTASMLEVGTGFNPELTGRENVYLNGAILGMSKSEIDAKFDQIVEFSEIGQFIDTPVKRYSSGMYVRLAFAVASHLEPDILIIDEVLAVGDQKFRQKCLDRMNEIAQSSKTIICVSHFMNVIRELCDRVLVLQDGRIIYDGETEGGIKVYSHDEMNTTCDYFDLRRAQRPSYILEKAHMNSLEILNNRERLLGLDERLKFKLNWTANLDIDDVKFRFIVKFTDGTNVGIALTGTLCDAKIGEVFNNTFLMDTGSLFPGKYVAALSLYQSDESGSWTNLDFVNDAVFFDVAELKDIDRSIVYSHQSWGHVRLPDIEIVE